MKYLLLATLLFTSSFIAPHHKDEYEIKDVYKPLKVAKGTKVVIRDDVKEPELFLEPTDMRSGHYPVKLEKKAENLYKIEGQDLYVETETCWESGWSMGATLIVKSDWGHTSGKVIFKKN